MREYFSLFTRLLSRYVTNDAEAKRKRFKDGSVYEGEIVKGIIVGQGRMTYANGDVYIGGWEDGKQSGRGVMSYANGNKYSGMWRLGVVWGQGVMTYANGDQYSGFWNEGKQSKEGVMTYVNGDKYRGEWVDGKAIGRGTFFNNETKREYTGSWLDDGVLDTSKEVQIIYESFVYISGNNQRVYGYTGEIKSDMRNGYGTLTFGNKDEYRCHWIDDEIDESKDVEIRYYSAQR